MSPQEEPKTQAGIETNSNPGSKKGLGSKKKILKIAGIATAAVLVLGGITAALVVRSIYNKPENVLATSLANYLLDAGDKNFDTTIKMSLEEATMGVKDVDINAAVQMSGKTTQIDLEVNASIIKLSGAIQSNENGNLYVKLNDLPALVATGALQAYGLTEEMTTQISSLDGKWIEVKPEDMASLTGKPAGTSSFDKCTDALYKAMADDALADSVDKSYKKNRFLLAKTAVSEKVGDRKLLKVEVGLDKAKFATFAQALSKSDAAKAVISDCNMTSETDAVATEDNGEMRNGKLTVWVDRGKKELVKLEASGDDYTADGKKNMTLTMTMNVKKPGAKLSAPSDSVNVMTILQGIGIDPAVLTGASQ